jgi:hypothetical protein
VIEHDVEDHVDVERVRGVHERVELRFRVRGIGGEARIDAQEIFDAVAVVDALVRGPVQHLAVEKHGRKPHGPDAERLQVGELRLHARDRSALKPAEGRVEGKLTGRRARIVETIEHQEIHEDVAPVGGRRRDPGRHVRECLPHFRGIDR